MEGLLNQVHVRLDHAEKIAAQRINELTKALISRDDLIVKLAGNNEELVERLGLAELQLSRLNYCLPVDERESFYEVPEARLLSKVKSIFGGNK